MSLSALWSHHTLKHHHAEVSSDRRNIIVFLLQIYYHVSIRYGLVVRIAGSHPAGPGSIPGNGISFVRVLFYETEMYKRSKKIGPFLGTQTSEFLIA
jgi:hypothetical protein